MSILIIRRSGKSRRFSRKPKLLHKPSGHGKGKWHCTRTLIAYKFKARRRRLIANESRRRNRG